mgnify:CR=1 FL=1
MRTLTIGETTLELNSFRKIRDKVVGVYADIKIPTTAISYEELKALFTDNQHDLIVTEDEATTTYSGYAQLDEIREKGGEYTVIQICTSEAIHLLNEARKQIEEQQGTIAEMGGVITAQDNELKAHAQIITEQNVIIGQQTELVGALEENAVLQTATLESLLLEVIPTVITETVTIAVAEALASNSTTEEETEVVE